MEYLIKINKQLKKRKARHFYRPVCNRCKKEMDRIPRGYFVKHLLPFLPLKRYFCDSCMRKSYRFHSDRKLIVPRTDILDQKDRYLIVVEMPGLRKEDIHIELNGYKLVVKGKQTNKQIFFIQQILLARTAIRRFLS